MADEKTIILTPDNQNNGNGLGNWWPLAFMGNGWNNGMFGGGNFWGSGIGAFLGGLFGSALPGFTNGGGFGGNGGGGAAAASLGAQATAIGNTETILRAVDGTDADVRLVATTLNSDINSVKDNLCTLGTSLAVMSGQTGLAREQIVNAILAGDASLGRQLCECCCNMKQLVTEQGYQNQIATLNQTNQLGGAITGSGQRTVDAIADLKATMIREFCDVKEREMQEKINTLTANNTLLRSQIDNANQTAAIGAMIAPIAQEVDDIKCKLPNTVSIPYPQLSVINTTPNFGPNYGSFYGGGFNGYGYGPGWGNGSYWG